jgi:hypothetical protein
VSPVDPVDPASPVEPVVPVAPVNPRGKRLKTVPFHSQTFVPTPKVEPTVGVDAVVPEVGNLKDIT